MTIGVEDDMVVTSDTTEIRTNTTPQNDARPPGQVWSLTQFYSVDFSQSRIGVKKSAFSTNAQSRFASFVVDGVLVSL